MSILENIKKKDSFTSTEQTVIKYIEHNLDNIIYMSISDLAEETYSSNATIIRICRKVGCNGFKEFKTALTVELQDKKHTTQTIDFSAPFTKGESVFEISNKISSLYLESIHLLSGNIKQSDIEMIAETIIKSERLFIFCVGDTKNTVKTFTNRLYKIGMFPIMCTEDSEEISISENIRPKDCALFVSYRGNTKKNNSYISTVKKSGCHIIAITSNEDSLICKYSNSKLILPSKENEKRIATYYSQVAFHYLLDILYSVIRLKVETERNEPKVQEKHK